MTKPNLRLGKGRCGCEIVVGSVQRGDETFFPLNRGGWAAAHDLAIKKAKASRMLALVDLKCTDGRIALYQCAADDRSGKASCGIESPGFSEAPGRDRPGIAGSRRRQRRY